MKNSASSGDNEVSVKKSGQTRMNIRKRFVAVFVGTVMLAVGASDLQAASIYIPNASFESPQTEFVDVNINFWQKSPKPWWYDESGGYYWSQLTGVFLNVAPSDPEHIDNCDGNQAVWLFAVPEVELFQDLTATFEMGKSYHLTVGIFGGGGNMKYGVPIQIGLYYRDAENKKVPVATTTFTYDKDIDYVKHLNDVQLDIAPVTVSDLWARKNIGVQMVSTLADYGMAGGYWVLDNVRLTKLGLGPDFTGDSFVDMEDFAVMAGKWLSCTDTTADLTGDGCVTMEDLKILLESWLESTPDFTGDSFVDLEDFAVMAQEWLSCTDTTTDLTGDGCVTTEDLAILVEAWLESMQE
jgi:hypothetical protein